jgi:cytochrome P450
MPLDAPRPHINFADPQNARNPFPVYKKLRDEFPICQLEPDGRFAISRYEDVIFALGNHALFAAGSNVIGRPDWVEEEYKRDLFILTKDPPDHTQYRALVNKAFVPRVLDALSPFMRDTAAQLIAEIRNRPTVDFLNDFALPYAVQVIGRITGDSSQTVEDLRRWTELVDKNTSERPDDAHILALQSATKKQYDLYDKIIAERRQMPQADLLTELLNTKIGEQRLTDREVRAGLDLFVSAGFQSSALFLTNALHLLANHPNVRMALQANHQLIPLFIDEALRLSSPAHALMRYATQSITLHDVTIPEGALVAIIIAAANRDDRKFDDPDTLNIHRPHLKKQIAFGHGVHTCLGASLARMEVQIALEALLSTFDTISCPPDDDIEWTNTLIIRAIQALPITLR